MSALTNSPSRRRIRVLAAAGGLTLAFSGGSPAQQADYQRYFDEKNVPAVRELFLAGQYDITLQVCRLADQRGQPAVDWRVLKFQSLAITGRAEEALAEAIQLLETYPEHIPALMDAHDVLAAHGRAEEAARVLDQVNAAALTLKREERGGLTQVALGRAALVLGADPQLVLRQYFDPVKAQKPKSKDDIPSGLIEARIASGELALEKSDYQRAAQEFRAALDFAPNHPGIRHGLARAFWPSDRKAAADHLERALAINPVHAPSLLLQAEMLINAEDHEAAEGRLAAVLGVNARHPLAWSYRAALDNLSRADAEAFAASRDKGLAAWLENPEVDHVIGRVLSRAYRFAEGAERQRAALELDPEYLPAKLQLAHDLLRVGDEDAAFALAAEVAEADPYDVLAHNLTVLRDEIAAFATLESPDFVIKMPAEEAEIYGDRAMELLTEAKETLGPKYGLELDHAVLVEFFPHQQDFAIRTFGNLGGAGILGACFGSVVTMNSPGSLAHNRNNWEATLWHEFCHVVTLTATRNKMPRWLSEGISVYEEMQRDPSWGQRMTPRYRQMILEEDALVPIGELSGAFLSPENPEKLMFAYYQSMLVVDYLVERHGLDNLRAILADLAEGVRINEAIERHAGALPFLEAGFAKHAIALAEDLAPGVDWTKPAREEVDPGNAASVAAYAEARPANLWARQAHTLNLLAAERWEEAAASADQLIALFPENTEGGGGYLPKARALRALDRREEEAEALRQLAALSAEAYSAYISLMDLDLESERWDELLAASRQAKAINPFLKHAHYCRGCAHEAREETAEATLSFEKLLALKPANPSEVRFRLARLLRGEDEERARRHLLDSLAEAPRYREAHALLLDLHDPVEEGSEEDDAPPPASPPGQPPASPAAPEAGAAPPPRP